MADLLEYGAHAVNEVSIMWRLGHSAVAYLSLDGSRSEKIVEYALAFYQTIVCLLNDIIVVGREHLTLGALSVRLCQGRARGSDIVGQVSIDTGLPISSWFGGLSSVPLEDWSRCSIVFHCSSGLP